MDQGASTQERVSMEEIAKITDYERYHKKLTPEFKQTIQEMVGDNFFIEGENIGVKFYQPKTEYDVQFPFSFSALFEGRMIMFTLKHPSKVENKRGYKAVIQPDFIFLDDYLDAIKKAESEGDFSKWHNGDKMKSMYLKRSEGLHPTTLSFGRGIVRLLTSIDHDTQVVSGTYDPKEYDLYVKLFKKFGKGATNFVLNPPKMTK